MPTPGPSTIAVAALGPVVMIVLAPTRSIVLLFPLTVMPLLPKLAVPPPPVTVIPVWVVLEPAVGAPILISTLPPKPAVLIVVPEAILIAPVEVLESSRVKAPLVAESVEPDAVCRSVPAPRTATELPDVLFKTTLPVLTSLMFTEPPADAVIADEFTLTAVAEPIAPVPIVPAVAVRLSGPNNSPLAPVDMLPVVEVNFSKEPPLFPKTPGTVIEPLAVMLLEKGVVTVDGRIRAPPVLKSNEPMGLVVAVTVKVDVVESLMSNESGVPTVNAVVLTWSGETFAVPIKPPGAFKTTDVVPETVSPTARPLIPPEPLAVRVTTAPLIVPPTVTLPLLAAASTVTLPVD
jgi:hypothetical protein